MITCDFDPARAKIISCISDLRPKLSLKGSAVHGNIIKVCTL